MMRLWLRENKRVPQIRFDKWVNTIDEAEKFVEAMRGECGPGDIFVLIGAGGKSIKVWETEQ